MATEADARPIADQATCFVAAKTEPAAGQGAATPGQPRQETISRWQQVTARCREATPPRRTAGDQPQRLHVIRMQAGMAARQLAAKAVASQVQGKIGKGGAHRVRCSGQVELQQFAVTPVLHATGAHAAAAVAAPFVHEYGNATRGQRLGKGLVMACGNAQCR